MNKRTIKWDRRFLRVADEISTWSKDPSTKVGCVIVRPDNTIAATGYNGFPPGADDSIEKYLDREYKYKHVIHAEANALSFLKDEIPLGYTAYITFPCCPSCMSLLSNAGISRVVYYALRTEHRSTEWITHWLELLAESRVIAQEHDITINVYDKN